jgi:beta-glucanase (GH16 family)
MMRRHPVRLLLLTALLGLTSCGGGGGGGGSSSQAAVTTSGPPTGYTLVWSDEFSNFGLPDASKWVYDTAQNKTGWFNNELQYYAANRLENSNVTGGKLIITARKEALTTQSDYGGQQYTSARLITRGQASWTYGFVEVRAKLPCGLGTWPAIWMLNTNGQWPAGGEIDIMEQTGKNPTTILGTVHTQLSGGPGTGAQTTVTDACSNFHNYQLTWTPQSIAMGVDGQIYYTYANNGGGSTSWPFDNPQYLLLNLAIGGDLGGAVDNAIFPVQMEVDYVRVYQKK